MLFIPRFDKLSTALLSLYTILYTILNKMKIKNGDNLGICG